LLAQQHSIIAIDLFPIQELRLRFDFPVAVNEKPALNGQQPGFTIRAGFEFMKEAESSETGFLD